MVKLRFGGELAEDRPISQSGESTAEKTKRPRRASSAAPGAAHSRRRRKSGGASGTSRHRRARKKAARPRIRRKHAAGDSAPTQKQVPHQTAPTIPTAPRDKNPPSGDAGSLQWHGDGRLAAETNYFLGNDPAKWRTHVQHFSRVVARGVLPGVDVVAYGNERALEYDLRVAPGVDARGLRLQISGADGMKLDVNGDLVILAAGREIRMKKPAMYEEAIASDSAYIKSSNPELQRRPVTGGYTIEGDGTVGFRIDAADVAARLDQAKLSGGGTKNLAGLGTLVIDPSLSVSYSTFLGGTGDDIATSITVDSSGKIYVSGTTTSAGTFSESSKKLGPGGGTSDYFIAKIDPTKSGLNSLLYLTFIGGSGDEEGGLLTQTETRRLPAPRRPLISRLPTEVRERREATTPRLRKSMRLAHNSSSPRFSAATERKPRKAPAELPWTAPEMFMWPWIRIPRICRLRIRRRCRHFKPRTVGALATVSW